MANNNMNRNNDTETQPQSISSQDPVEGRPDVPPEDSSKDDTKPSLKRRYDTDKAFRKNEGTDSNEDPAEGHRDVI